MKTIRDLLNLNVCDKDNYIQSFDETLKFIGDYAETVIEEAEYESIISNINYDCFPSMNEALEKMFETDFMPAFLFSKKPVLITTDISSKKARTFYGIVYSPVIPRDWRAEKNEDYLDLEIKEYKVKKIKKLPEKVDLIVTRHTATRDLLVSLYPSASVLESSVNAEDIKDKVVAGVLPPTLIAECESFVKFTVKKFDYSKDNDMSLLELQQRGYDLTHIQVKEVK